jgi:ketosteroid isomerase-like protein
MTATQNNDIADRMFAAIEDGDGAQLAALWSDDITVWRLGGGPVRDKPRALKVIAWFVDSTTDRRYEGNDSNHLYCVASTNGGQSMNAIHAYDVTKPAGSKVSAYAFPPYRAGHCHAPARCAKIKRAPIRRGCAQNAGSMEDLIRNQAWRAEFGQIAIAFFDNFDCRENLGHRGGNAFARMGAMG